MTPRNNQEIKGNLQSRSLAELLAEIADAQFDGSLRLAHENYKVIIYFSGGEVVFAASNARSSRLFDILLCEKKIDQFVLKANPNFVNDMEFAKNLVEQNLFTQEAMDGLFAHQIENILHEALGWKTGDWQFSHLVRIKENIRFQINSRKILFDFGHTLSENETLEKFSGEDETFSLAPPFSNNFSPNPHEAFILSRFANSSLTLGEIKSISGLPEAKTLQILYVLWLGGFLVRRNWDSLFSEELGEMIRSAKLELKKPVFKPAPLKLETLPVKPKVVEEEPEEEPEGAEEMTLEEYLAQIKASTNYYEVLDIDPKCDFSEIKTAYFNFAKRFHPDHFHKGTDATVFQQIQDAFAQLAQAYDTLKNKDSRESYDFKIRKELAKREEMKAAGISEEKFSEEEQKDMATDNFDKGFDLLMEEAYEEAMPYLARAAHLSPDVARFRAYYGKILSYIEKQRHKAEQELQTAIKLEPNNTTFRLMLVEFFIQYKLYKRAEGELNRLLAIEPDNKEAQILLSDLAKK